MQLFNSATNMTTVGTTPSNANRFMCGLTVLNVSHLLACGGLSRNPDNSIKQCEVYDDTSRYNNLPPGIRLRRTCGRHLPICQPPTPVWSW